MEFTCAESAEHDMIPGLCIYYSISPFNESSCQSGQAYPFSMFLSSSMRH
jgi:hypothetical protein